MDIEEITVELVDPLPPVEINETTFPDPVFRQYVLEHFDRDGDGVLDSYDLERDLVHYYGSGKTSWDSSTHEWITTIDQARSLQGISYFKKCTTLYIEGADSLTMIGDIFNLKLHVLHIDRCPRLTCVINLEPLADTLTEFRFEHWETLNQLENINKCKKLEYLTLLGQNLNSISGHYAASVSKSKFQDFYWTVYDLPNLKELHLRSLFLSSGWSDRLSTFPKLESLTIDYININELNLKGCTALKYIRLANTYISTENDSCNLKYVPNLERLYIVEDRNIQHLNFSYTPKLKILQLSNLGHLEEIDIHTNINLVSLSIDDKINYDHGGDIGQYSPWSNSDVPIDVTHNTKLKILKISCHTVSSIDTSHNKKLRELSITGASIMTLDLTALTKLRYLTIDCPTLNNLVGAENASGLYEINIKASALTNFDLTPYRLAYYLDINYSPNISEIDIRKSPVLNEIYRTLEFNEVKYLFDRPGFDVSRTIISYTDIDDNKINLIRYNGGDFRVTYLSSAETFPLDIGWNYNMNMYEQENDSSNYLSPGSFGYLSNNYRNLRLCIPADLTVLSKPSDPADFGGLAADDPIEITVQPQDASVNVGESVSFTVEATGENIEYLWQVKPYGKEWTDCVTGNGARTATYTIASAAGAQHNSQYRCLLSNNSSTVYTDEVTLTLLNYNPPRILMQPKSITVENGHTGYFYIRVDDDNAQYQWQRKVNTSWVDLSGATAFQYAVTATPGLDQKEHRCRVYNDDGETYSDVATISVITNSAIGTNFPGGGSGESSSLRISGYHSIYISGKNTFFDYGMYPTSRPLVNPPEVKTSFLDNPAADGILDYTDALTGVTLYGARKGYWEFWLCPEAKWPQVYSTLLNALHGVKHTIILEDDPGYYYTGRLSVNSWKSDPHNSLLVIDYVLDPYKVAISQLSEDWLWDDYYERTIQYKTINVQGSKKISIVIPEQQTLYPKFYLPGDMTIYIRINKGSLMELHPGYNENADHSFVFDKDYNVVEFSGNGEVILTYREVSL